LNQVINSYFKTPYGELIIGSFRNQLILCDWRYRKRRAQIDQRISTHLEVEYVEGTSEVIEKCIDQLNEYFNGKRKQFEIPIHFVGTDFQKKVWNELLKVQFGETISYLELSKRMKQESAIRAISSANGANAISILVPCHRIIGSNGDLVGYAGGLPTKKALLKHEGALNKSQLELF
jgi:methylated-DNA-[protein]-cysteine S-methyltransferase